MPTSTSPSTSPACDPLALPWTGMGTKRRRDDYGALYLQLLRPPGMTPEAHHRLEVAAVVGVFTVALAVLLLVIIGIATSAGYVPGQ